MKKMMQVKTRMTKTNEFDNFRWINPDLQFTDDGDSRSLVFAQKTKKNKKNKKMGVTIPLGIHVDASTSIPFSQCIHQYSGLFASKQKGRAGSLTYFHRGLTSEWLLWTEERKRREDWGRTVEAKIEPSLCFQQCFSRFLVTSSTSQCA
jgi:hypothetical protein